MRKFESMDGDNAIETPSVIKIPCKTSTHTHSTSPNERETRKTSRNVRVASDGGREGKKEAI